MVNSDEFIKRLEKILDFYGLSSAAFADKISVQRSSISHLLSGRNKPSLEFVLKIISAFPEVNLYWLLNGKGTFPSNPEKEIQATLPPSEIVKENSTSKKSVSKKNIEKVIIFYDDGSFEAYNM
tara:strand:+ start:142347 stop:142718 length:372 start_codon:yes stop_codon:yes gene_type:complete